MPKENPKNKKTVNSAKKSAPAAKSKKTEPKASSVASTTREKSAMSKTSTKTPARPQEKQQEKKTGKVPFKKEISQKLSDAKQRILQEVSQKVRSESNVLKYEIGDIYDIASSERERELTLMLGDRDREKLSEIEDALERLKDNSYGVCEECGEPIAEDRLRALPATRVCVECMSKMERELKIKGRGFEEEPGFGILERSESEEEEF